MNGNSSGISKGNQMSFEQYESALNEAEAENNLRDMYYEYLRNELPISSPIQIPQTSTIKEESKNGYHQIKYEWTHEEYNYLSRWHTHTPNAPDYSQDTWVVERKLPGIGYGKHFRRPIHEVLIKGRGWVDWKEWDKARKARAHHSETKEQRELLDNGHWPA